MKTIFPLSIAAVLTTAGVSAQSTTQSNHFKLLQTPAGDIGGGGPVANAGSTVTAEISIGDSTAGGVSDTSMSGVQSKGNLTGQLFDVKTVTLTATPASVSEGGTLPLTARAGLDDATTLNLAPADLIWGFSPPTVTQVNALSGVVTAGKVFEDTVTQVFGTYQGVSGQIPLTVLNVNADDYPGYAADGIDDDWQVDYFGQPPNTNAGPAANPDSDPHDNLFEFLSGFDPTDGSDFFRVTPMGFSAPHTMDLRLNKVIPGRVYRVRSSPDLVAPFAPTGSPISVATGESNKLFQDNSATTGRKFYQVEITRP